MIWRLLRGSGYVVCTVHERPDAPADRLDRAEALVFVRDGFSLAAAVFAPLWLLAGRLWAALLGYLLVVGAVVGASYAAGLPEIVAVIAIAALHLMIGLESDSLRRWSLEVAGWQMLGSATGDNQADCERRFFDSWLPAQPIIRIAHTGSSAPPPVTAAPPHAATVSKPSRWRALIPRNS